MDETTLTVESNTPENEFADWAWIAEKLRLAYMTTIDDVAAALRADRDRAVRFLRQVVATGIASDAPSEDACSVSAAISFLAEFRATEAAVEAAALARLNDQQLDELFGDSLHENLPGELAEVFRAEPEIPLGWLDDPRLDDTVRGVAAQIATAMVARGYVAADVAGAAMAKSLEATMVDPSLRDLSAHFVCELIDFWPKSSRPVIERAFASGNVALYVVDVDYWREHTDHATEDKLDRYADRRPTDDAVRTILAWHGSKCDCQPCRDKRAAWERERERRARRVIRKVMFNHDNPDVFKHRDDVTPEAEFAAEVEEGARAARSLLREVVPDGYSAIIRNSGRKVGRNEPCPCGSGEKHKNCCMKR